MTSRTLRLALGLVTGLVTLVAMVRLVSGAFSGAMSGFAWVVTLVAMVPWVVHAGWRARRARLGRRAGTAVVGLDVAGVALVGLRVAGPVLALGLSFAAYAFLWAADRPTRPAAGPDRFVRVDELREPDPDDPGEPDDPPA